MMGDRCQDAWKNWQAHPWEHFLEAHPVCGHDKDEKVSAGVAGYTAAPYLAWSGWRYRIPGGPIGGQYHGFIAPDDSVDGMGWPAGHDETFRPIDNPAGLGAMPWQGWDDVWGGIPLNEGETVSDYVYRGPAEIRPRPNASGGTHTVRAVQTQRSPGYAIAPGNYRGLGYVVDQWPGRGDVPWRPEPLTPISNMGPVRACPAWGCGGPTFPIWREGPSPTVPQPPPPSSPQPGPITATGCPSGQYQDAAGNCTSDWRNPYSLYLPDSYSPAPAPTVAANTCPTGYTQDPNTGNCLAPGAAPAGSGIGAWLGASTTIGGVNIPNVALAGVGALLAFKMLGGRR